MVEIPPIIPLQYFSQDLIGKKKKGGGYLPLEEIFTYSWRRCGSLYYFLNTSSPRTLSLAHGIVKKNVQLSLLAKES